MPDEHGNPMAGEWWGQDGKPVWYMIGRNTKGQMVYQGSAQSMAYTSLNDCWDQCEHLPDCTGWDWQAPDWVELDPVNHGWHVLRADVDQCKYRHHERFVPVVDIAGLTVAKCSYAYTFRCLRKDLPQKPPEPVKPAGPTTWHTTNEDKVLIWGAIHNMQAAVGRIEAQLRADADRDKFFESVM